MKMVEYFKKYHRQSSFYLSDDLSGHLLLDEILILSHSCPVRDPTKGKRVEELADIV